MSENNFFSAGAIVFYLLVLLVIVSLWLAVRNSQKVRSRSYGPATPGQMRMSPDEREKILDFLRENELQRLRIGKIEIIVERGRKEDCLYAQDLKYVFDLAHWGPAEITEETPPEKVVRGKAVWFESSVNDEFARTFWKQTLCCLSQDFYHEDQVSVPLNTWMFFIRDSEGGTEPYSPEVMCPNKRPGQKSLP